MSKNIDFQIGTIVTDEFLDNMQELLTGTIQNARLAPGTASDRLKLSISGDIHYDKLGAVNIGGKYCYFENDQDSSAAQAGDGTKKIYLSTTDNGSPKQPNFSVSISSSAPAASYIKQIGTVEKSGSSLSNAKMITGVQADHEQYNSFTFRSILNTTDETVLTIDGQSGQPSSAGVTYQSDLSTSPTKALSVGQAGTEKLYIDTAGRVVFTDATSEVGLQAATYDSEAVLTTGSHFTVEIGETAGESAISTRIAGDDEPRVVLLNDGAVAWGTGSDPYDVYIERIDVGELALGSGHKLYMDYTITGADADDLLVNKEYVDGLVSGTADDSKRFAFFIG